MVSQTLDPAVREAAQARAEAAAVAAHTAAQGGRRVPVLDTAPEYRAQLRQIRQQLPAGVGAARLTTFPGRMERAGTMVRRNGKELAHVAGYATVFARPYDMFDEHGPYREYVAVGAADGTLRADPDVMFLMNHRGALMARTHVAPGMAPTLELRADRVGMFDDAYVNPTRPDVQILLSAIDDGLMTEQSFAFMVTAGGWDEDFEQYGIDAFDIHRGDVSGVNMGANPYTDIGARAQELAALVTRMPPAMARRAVEQMTRTVDAAGPRVLVGAPRRQADGEGEPTAPSVRRIAARIARTSQRIAELAAVDGTVSLGDVALPWYSIRNADGEGQGDGGEPQGPATVYVFDEIGGSFGVSAKAFAREVNAITAPEIRVRINSPGGSVFDGITIMNTLIAHPSHVVVYVDGVAASAASVVAMAGAEIVMMPGSQMMIHDASMTDDGNAHEKEQAALYLHRQSDNIARLYAGASRQGGDAAYWRDLMTAETWAFSDEAVELGLADRVQELTVAAAAVACTECGAPHPAGTEACDGCGATMRMSRRHDLSRYRYAGRGHAPAPGQRTAAGGIPVRRGGQDAPMGRSLIQIRAQLGLDEDD